MKPVGARQLGLNVRCKKMAPASRKETIMAVKKRKQKPEEMRCATCRIRQRAEANPESFMSRLWKWHTGWCPGWKAYVNSLPDERRAEVIKKYRLESAI